MLRLCRGAMYGRRVFSQCGALRHLSKSPAVEDLSVAEVAAPTLIPVDGNPLSSTQRTLSVALVGRPNVGKSTLFNRLTNTKKAIVSAVPGTTRDRREGVGHLAGMPVHVVDTGGLDDRGEISSHILAQVKWAIKDADVVLFMLDSRTGITAVDRHYAQWLRRTIGQLEEEALCDGLGDEDAPEKERKIILVANKAEGAFGSDSLADTAATALQLGFGEVLPLSAAHGDGLADLAGSLVVEARQRNCLEDEQASENDRSGGKKKGENHHRTTAIPAAERTIQMALMGRPNVGKSTLLNAIVGSERAITGPVAGLTRDAVQVGWTHNNRQFLLVDTAGLTRTRPVATFLDVKREGKTVERQEARGMALTGPGAKELRVIDGVASNKVRVPLPGVRDLDPEADPSQHSYLVNELSLLSALNALKYAQVVCLVVDSQQQNFSKIDLQLARMCLTEGRGLVILANKRDLLDGSGVSTTAFADGVKAHTDEYLREFGDIPVIPTSGLQGKGIERALREITRTHDSWSYRVETWVLNQWIRDTIASAPKPRAGDKDITIKYMTQISSRPPEFLISTNVQEIPRHFERYLRSRMQTDFDLRGVPIRFVVRKSKGKPVKKELLKHNVGGRRHKGQGEGRGVGPKNRDVNITVRKHVMGDVRDQRRRRDTRQRRILKTQKNWKAAKAN